MQDTLHDRLVDLFCRNDGWKTGPWKPAFRAKCRENPAWLGDFEDGGKDDLWAGIRFNPDAWRLVVEGADTPNTPWNYDVLIVEFLEIEIFHPIPLDKRRNLIDLWWRFDSTSCFHMRVYCAGRYGDAKLWLDTESAIREVAL